MRYAFAYGVERRLERLFPIGQVEAVALHLRDPTGAGRRGVHFSHNDRSRRKSTISRPDGEVRSSAAPEHFRVQSDVRAFRNGQLCDF
jgi:hypothetical protein